MLIPIRCFTCGKPLADKYDYYLKEVQKLQKKEDTKDEKGTPVSKKKAGEEEQYKHFESLRTGPVLDKLGLNRYCCRRHMLGTVDMMDTI
jgi:DNA-directed RNA polymerase I, II, and III subunit RPABC5